MFTLLHSLKSHWLLLLITATGAGLGYLYWQEIGCISGTCSITSSPVNSTAYGALMAYLSFGVVKDFTKKK
jgi:hypothetical protein